MRILFVDDDPVWLGLVKEILREVTGGTAPVATALTGAQALRLVKRYPFEMAMIDIKLCDMSGIDLISEIRKLKPHIEIAAVTGSHDLSVIAQAKSAGAKHYLAKPVTAAALSGLIDKVTAHFDVKEAVSA